MNQSTTESQISGKIYVVTAECSQTATETFEKKLERLICRHVSDSKSYQPTRDVALAVCEIVREHGTGII